MLSTSHQLGAKFVRVSPHHNARIFANPFAADIRFYVASSIGVISSSLVTTRRLHHVVNMTATATNFSSARRRRNMLTGLLIGHRIPHLAVALCESPF